MEERYSESKLKLLTASRKSGATFKKGETDSPFKANERTAYPKADDSLGALNQDYEASGVNSPLEPNKEI